MEIPSQDQEPKQESEGVGPLVAIIIIVGLLAAAGIYFLVTQEMNRGALPTQEQALLR